MKEGYKEEEAVISREPPHPKLRIQIIMLCKGVYTGYCTLGC